MKMTKQKLVFIGLIGSVVLFIAGYAYWKFGMEDEDAAEVETVAVPELETSKPEFATKKEAVDALEPEREFTPPSVYDDKQLDTMRITIDSLAVVGEGVADGNDSVVHTGYADKEEVPQITWLKEARGESDGDDYDKKDNDKLVKELAKQQEHLFTGVELENMDLIADTDALLYVKVRGTQTVQSKYRLELELMKSARVRGKVFERYTRLYGFVSFQPNRTLLHITHIGTLEVSLKAYDKQDGSEGIYTVNSFRAEATKEAVTQTIGDINIPTMPVRTSFLQQLVQKNNRKVKVTVSDGYELILKPEL
ncbi:Protein of unknown function [Pustulibacterium marinum]|uniref:Conjugative transposon TraM C-terminal domain-containing protein n=1 Tax=Pustulibacterium marinum TaxID=1224947 RepID=A0A1I7HTS8_9FLAO|nr:conjugative transposon protein TraM [Pustulibacterium marinum]SFU64041.1 Protein of unknown function [Pustulibacterium marinum]